MFLPTTPEEFSQLGWQQADVILITGDTYIDSPFTGVALIGHHLTKLGYKVAVIAQPDIDSGEDISRLGEPRLFWGVSAGCMDSMVANYTALGKKRRQDDFTPGGENNRRPDRAILTYCNLIRRHFKQTAPIVIGGVEASLRRVVHYDYWSNKLRGSVLLDAKADVLVYGMGERTIAELAQRFDTGADWQDLRGICYASNATNDAFIQLPSLEACRQDKSAFIEMFRRFYAGNDPKISRGLAQQHGARWLIHNPPAAYLDEGEMDTIHEYDYELDVHPFYAQGGEVRALETIRFGIPTHRGCYGECNFCAIAVHQGRTVRSRSISSVVRSAERFGTHGRYKGQITDLGGPTANMYGFDCAKKLRQGACEHQRCLFPETCQGLKVTHRPHRQLLKQLRQLPSIKRIFIASGIRYDLILADQQEGDAYLQEVVSNHVSGQMKVAPEHTSDRILELMGKPGTDQLLAFRERFTALNEAAGKKQFLTYYLIAAHPGCSEKEMAELRDFSRKELQVRPEQVQIFTPTPSTWSSVMYYTEVDPFTGQRIFVERGAGGKQKQKALVTEQVQRGRSRGGAGYGKPQGQRRNSNGRHRRPDSRNSKRS